MRLHVRGVTWVRGGRKIHPLEDFPALDEAGVPGLIEFDLVARFHDSVGDGFHVDAVDAVEPNALSSEGCGGHKSACLDTVGDDGVLDAFEFLHALYYYTSSTGSGDLRAHGVEKIREIDYLRLCGGGFDDGDALCEGCGHHDIVCAEDGGSVVST